MATTEQTMNNKQVSSRSNSEQSVQPQMVNLEVREEFNLAETMSQCYQCGTCTATCPLNEYTSNGGQKMSIRKIFHQAQLGLEPDELVWNCSSCKLCEVRCPRQVDIVGNIQHIRRHSYKRKNAPPEFEQVLWNLLEEANPQGEPKAKRGEWAEGLDICPAKEGTDFLFYVGGPESYDPRLQKVARDMTKIMENANTDYGILGKQEPTSGETIREIGDYAYLDWIIEKNVELLNSTGVNKIVVLSPHAYDLMKHIYPEYGLEPQVYHYTEVLNVLWTNDNLNFNNKLDGEITYHDPCFLGRYNGLYEEPRNLIEDMGLNLVEMKDNKSNALCCGGGGNQMYKESDDDARLSDVRVKQAIETRTPDLITSCGYCVQNFEDSVKVSNSNLMVSDLIELIIKAVE